MKLFTKQTALLCISLLLAHTLFAQTYNISGKILDKKDNSSLIGVTVLLINSNDTSKKNGTATDANGSFEIDNVYPGQYILKSIYLGYKNLSRKLTVTNSNFDLGPLKMETGTNTLDDVIVEAKQVRAQQSGDTTQFNANAYKTHPDATAEDLVTKMPGVTSDNSGVKVNGEAVQQVYVDGKPFFGTDPTLALKNLPSEVIDKIQVFDKLSDQSQFTGFDDGNSQKTMNIITRKNKSNGQFGKIYAGYGTDDTYLAGGNLNIFDGDRRISILGLSNNINQQNFSSQDILGITGGNQNRGGMGFSGSSRGSFGGGGAASNFLVGQQAGVTTTNSAGINYSDNWGKKIKVTASYFYNSTDNINNTSLTRTYYSKSSTDTNFNSELYSERDSSESKNYNHRFNLRFEYTIDSFNSLIITPGLSFQKNNTTSEQFDTSSNSKTGTPYNIAQTSTPTNNNGYSFSNNLLLQHKFLKKGRTISLNINTSLNEKSTDGLLSSSLFYLNTLADINQHYTQYNNGYTISPSINYTEPVGKNGQLMFNYSPSYTKSSSDKETDSTNEITRNAGFDSLFSNKYHSTYTVQRGGISYRFNKRKMNFMLGANLQSAQLDGTQTLPNSFNTSKTFTDFLPSAMFNYRAADGKNLRIFYRTNITAPTITQLQNVVDISNPQLLKTGNASLLQDYEHTLILRYGNTKAEKGHNIFLFVYANYINNYIGNATFIPNPRGGDSGLANGIKIPVGGQLSMPVNINGYFNGRSFLTYAIPLQIIKSNLNLNGGISYTRTPGLINNIANNSDNIAPTAGVVVSSNISEKIDFTLAYTANYNIVNNSVQSQANSNYYSHVASFKINYIFLKNFVFNTNITHTYYAMQTGTSGNEQLLLWNAYLGYKLLKNHALEARIAANDILNQNKNINRTVTDLYIENSVTNVLKQYFMFSLTYTLRNFKPGTIMPATDDKESNMRDMYRGMYHGGSGHDH